MIGIVVIGRNEGERLRRCLASVAEIGCPLVYVDSGSTDGSLASAERAGARVVALDAAEGFTAARARNRGFRELVGIAAPRTLDFVQFVDGDCELVPGWIDLAAERLCADPGLGVVAGRRRERDPDASRYNRLCDMEWNTPIGPARAVGGDAMYRACAFAELGGFDADLICGEEPELCLRLRSAGWRVERLDADMALHDAAMTRFGQWWQRARRSGWAIAEGVALHGGSAERYNVRALGSVLFWGGVLPVLALGAVGLAQVQQGSGSSLAALAGIAVISYPIMMLRIAHGRRRRLGDEWRHALLYGAFTMIAKVPQLLGVLGFARARRGGRKARIIEYKDVVGDV